MHIGILPGSFKPFHKGHLKLLEKAANECDKVILIVSLLDRENISGQQMAQVWKNHLLPIMPENVDVVFLESSPIARVFQILKLREDMPDSNYTFSIYSDDYDIRKHYAKSTIIKTCPTLFMDDGIKTVPVSREDTCSISGTDIRSFISKGDYNSFAQYMPDNINSQEVFDILSGKHKAC